MEPLLKILILLLLIIILILLFLIIFGVIYFYRKNLFKSAEPKRPRLEYNCVNHPQIPSGGTCAICSQNFCEGCLKEHDKLHFCPEHFELFFKHQWTQLEAVKTTPDCPEEAMHLYRFKEKKWTSQKIPTYVVTHYKINLESEHIESHIQLFGREEESQLLKEELQNEKEPQERGSSQ